MVLQFLQRFRKRLVEHLDITLLVITLMIMACGLATIYSATYYSSNRALGQVMNMGVGLVAMWLFLPCMWQDAYAVGQNGCVLNYSKTADL